ncbi:uncharacterized protein [Notamacropus eugenii]|uniref:uncharacterized protein n=1 Tax=Notamacropus eugenii TaxID=9315 RepID=UPI003B677494
METVQPDFRDPSEHAHLALPFLSDAAQITRVSFAHAHLSSLSPPASRGRPTRPRASPMSTAHSTLRRRASSGPRARRGSRGPQARPGSAWPEEGRAPPALRSNSRERSAPAQGAGPRNAPTPGLLFMICNLRCFTACTFINYRKQKGDMRDSSLQLHEPQKLYMQQQGHDCEVKHASLGTQLGRISPKRMREMKKAHQSGGCMDLEPKPPAPRVCPPSSGELQLAHRASRRRSAYIPVHRQVVTQARLRHCQWEL